MPCPENILKIFCPQVFEGRDWEQLLARSIVPKLAFALQVRPGEGGLWLYVPVFACLFVLSLPLRAASARCGARGF